MIALFLILISLFLNAIGIILLKKGATSYKRIFWNPITISGNLFYVAVIAINLKILELVQLKYFSLLMALNFLLAYIIGIMIFNEKTNWVGYLGIVTVCFGVLLVNIQ